MAPSNKPSVIIFGGLHTFSRSLAQYLVPLDGEPLVSHLRIVDKFSVFPPTTYVGPDFPKVLAKPQVEYKQANLTVEANIPPLFEPSEGQTSFDYVFDLTGETRPDRSAEIQINTTVNVARMIAKEAAKREVKAYVRMQLPWYVTSTKGPQAESEDIKPIENIGVWWHETLRVLAGIDNLNLVILRVANGYGPYIDFGETATALAIAAVYGHLKKPMKSMWGPGKHPTNTVHAIDIAGALWACAEWIAPLGRSAANDKAGEEVPFHNEKSKVKGIEGVPPPDKKLVAPVFNLADDTNSSLLHVCTTVTSFFGTTTEFLSTTENLVARVGSMILKDSVVEDTNEEHMGVWTEMIMKATPPVPDTPITPYIDHYGLSKRVVGFKNDKIKNIVGYKLKYPQFGEDNIREVVDTWKAEGIWPVLS